MCLGLVIRNMMEYMYKLIVLLLYLHALLMLFYFSKYTSKKNYKFGCQQKYQIITYFASKIVNNEQSKTPLIPNSLKV